LNRKSETYFLPEKVNYGGMRKNNPADNDTGPRQKTTEVPFRPAGGKDCRFVGQFKKFGKRKAGEYLRTIAAAEKRPATACPVNGIV